EKAIACDARYAFAHSCLAHATVALHGYAAAPQDILKAAVERARHAVELNPQEGACHRILARILLFARNYDLAEHHNSRSLELNPNDAGAMAARGDLFTNRGHSEEGLIWIEKAMRLNPFYPTWYNVTLGVTLYALRRFQEASQAFDRLPQSGHWSRVYRAA